MKKGKAKKASKSSTEGEREKFLGKKNSIIPKGEWKPGFEYATLIKTEHPFLKEILRLLEQQKDTFVLHSFRVLFITRFVEEVPRTTAVIYIYDDHILLDFIVTKKDERNQGKANDLLKIITKAADATRTKFHLTIGDNGLGLNSRWLQMMVASQGDEHEERISKAKLLKWFSKFGFVQSGSNTRGPILMERKPQSK